MLWAQIFSIYITENRKVLQSLSIAICIPCVCLLIEMLSNLSFSTTKFFSKTKMDVQ